MNSNFIEYLGGEEKLKQYEKNYKLNYLKKYLSKERMVEEDAYIKIKKIDESFLNSIKKRILNENDQKNSRAALGELRAYANLCDLGCKIKNNGIKKGCDFTLNIRDEDVFVEVYTIQESLDSKIQVDKSTTILHPFGTPKKKCDNVTSNMISRICAAKSKAKQASSNIPSILYIDFCDIDFVGSSIDHCQSISSFRDGIYSGGYWLGFYGEKGTKILGDFSVHGKNFKIMNHDGRFHKNNKDNFCGALLSFPQVCQIGSLVFFENPNRLAPNHFKMHLANSENMNWEFSCWKFGDDFDLNNYISLQNDKINMIYNQIDSLIKYIFPDNK